MADDTVSGPADLEAELDRVRDEAATCRAELLALTRSAHSVLRERDFATTARAIFDHCRDLIGATSGYVALLSSDGSENEVLFLEAGGLACSVDPSLPMPIRGLRADAYHEKRAVYDNRFMASEHAKLMPGGHVELQNVMFAPLTIDGITVGLIGLANKHGGFTDDDARAATVFGELAAIALSNSRDREARVKAEREREKIIEDLSDALAHVKELGGLLPICSNCKKIRDDEGYWSQIEEYISRHTHAEFSHGICPDCVQKLYPDFDYGDILKSGGAGESKTKSGRPSADLPDSDKSDEAV
jgi:hypothetical protein